MHAKSLGVLLVLGLCVASCRDPGPKPRTGHVLTTSELQVALRDNGAERGDGLSGIGALSHRENDVYAFTLENAGLNYEHVMSGSSNPLNGFTPRGGSLSPAVGPNSVVLTREAVDSPWLVGAKITYTVVEPHYVDMVFEATVEDASLFDPAGYVAFFFASYMAWVEDPEIHWKGFAAAGSPMEWVHSSANSTDPGDHYLPLGAPSLNSPADDPVLSLHAGNEDWPRIGLPFYYGRARPDMVYAVMFDTLYEADEEIRFTVMRWLLDKRPSPAWDFTYVARDLYDGKQVGFRARMVWKPWVSEDDVEAEYWSWVAGLK
jgi:hypothetical protein